MIVVSHHTQIFDELSALLQSRSSRCVMTVSSLSRSMLISVILTNIALSVFLFSGCQEESRESSTSRLGSTSGVTDLVRVNSPKIKHIEAQHVGAQHVGAQHIEAQQRETQQRERDDARIGSRSEIEIEESPTLKRFKDGALQLDIERLIVARDVKQRRAIGEASTFPNTVSSLWGLASVRASGRSAQLELRWWRGQNLVSVSPFVVSEGIKWSEWSQVTVRPKDTGAWRVELFYPAQEFTLTTYTFEVDNTHSSANRVAAHTGESTDKGDAIHHATLTIDKARKPESTAPLGVRRLQVARAVKRRRPLGVGTRFKLSDERLWGYVEVVNYQRPQYVWMEWSRGDQLRSRLKVRVGVSRSWRTWSWQRLSRYDTGRWELKVTSPEGEPLAQTHFVVDP